MIENFSKIIKEIKLHIQKVQRTLSTKYQKQKFIFNKVKNKKNRYIIVK